MSDPPVHHDPPPFTAEDIRISPSGPYVPGGVGGGIILFGADAVEQTLALTDTNADFLPLPRSTSPAAPLAVTFPSWGSGNILWINWYVNGLWEPDGTGDGAEIVVYPVVTIDGSGPQFIDPGQVDSRVPFITGEGQTATSAELSGTLAIKITDPAQPPVVQLYYLIVAPDGTVSFNVKGLAQTEATGSAWLCCAELDSATVFQFPATSLTPVT